MSTYSSAKPRVAAAVSLTLVRWPAFVVGGVFLFYFVFHEGVIKERDRHRVRYVLNIEQLILVKMHVSLLSSLTLPFCLELRATTH